MVSPGLLGFHWLSDFLMVATDFGFQELQWRGMCGGLVKKKSQAQVFKPLYLKFREGFLQKSIYLPFGN